MLLIGQRVNWRRKEATGQEGMDGGGAGGAVCRIKNQQLGERTFIQKYLFISSQHMRTSEEERLKRSPLKIVGTETVKKRITKQKQGTERRQDAKMERKKEEKRGVWSKNNL